MKSVWLGVAGCVVVVMAGCGGGGGGDTASSTATTGTGVLLDAPVSGVQYASGGVSGTTGPDGAFRYEAGQSVTFKVGDVVLGTVSAGTSGTMVVTPLELAGAQDVSDPVVQQIAVFLQTLDKDGDPSNGIEIDQQVAVAAQGQSVNFQDPDSVRNALNVIAPNKTPVAVTAAKTHMEQSRHAVMAGVYAGTYSGSCTTGELSAGTWRVTVAADGSVSGTATESGDNQVRVVSGSADYLGSYSGTSSEANWKGSIQLSGIFSGTWSNPIWGCSGSFSGGKLTDTPETYVGQYAGTFSGTDTGSWQVSIASDGTVSGSGVSAQDGPFTISGSVSGDGSVVFAGGSASTGATFRGSVNAYGSIWGSWQNGLGNGTFSGFRQVP